jgi:hypothetical protein
MLQLTALSSKKRLMKASLTTAHYGRTSLIAPYERAASPKKLVRRDEVARLYGVSASVKNILPHDSKNNPCLLIQGA